ncbi:MAG: hypothetical protein WKF34_13180 [Pyrinomonadaceae bacterium]
MQTRNAQSRLLVKLREAEADVDMLRIEINALENSAAQTEKAVDSLLVATRSGSRLTMRIDDDYDKNVPQRGNRERADVRDLQSFRRDNRVAYFTPSRGGIPSINNNFEPISSRFSDRTITQSCRLLLSEANAPLHVNELYNLLVAGGMKFKGNNPTISVAVSLSRNPDFRKVDPGTFDLVKRDTLRVAS